MTASLVD